MAPKRKNGTTTGTARKTAKTTGKAAEAATAEPALLSAGDRCPEFDVLDNESNDFRLMERVKEKGAVIFVYPKANTPGCTKQARGFRDNFADIERAGYQVFGMSADGPNAQSNWRVKEDIPFPLLCDKKKVAMRKLGFVNGEKIVRGHIVVGRKGIVQQYCPGMKPLESVERATEFCIEKGKEGDEDEGEGETG